MSHRHNIKIWIGIILLGLMYVGCAAIQEEEKYAELNGKLKPMVGCSKSDFLLRFGPPDERFAEGDIEVWRYAKFHGERIKSKSYGAKTIRQYDIVDVYFRKDSMIKYRIDVKR